MPHILVVEDEISISDLLKLALSKADYSVSCVYDGLAAADALDRGHFDLILLDVMLPGTDGFSLMEYIRPLQIPVIFLTAKDSVEDRVRGLKLGAEDYIVKPFALSELLARVEVVLRRQQQFSAHSIAGIEINTRSHTVSRSGNPIALTCKEYELLLLFAAQPGSVLTREVLYERVWGSDYPCDSRTLELHVQRMRRKVGWQDCLVSVPKVGYRLEV